MRLWILVLLQFVRVVAGMKVVDDRSQFRYIHNVPKYINSLELVRTANNYVEHCTVPNLREYKLSIVGIPQ